MRLINRHSRFIPYFYFISIIAYWFTDMNQDNGTTSYLILILGFPFLWQIIKPNKLLNISLGITFTCLSSYLILAYLSDLVNLVSSTLLKGFVFYGGIFVVCNFVMSTWIVKNSLNRAF